jgi:hypothetical protein
VTATGFTVSARMLGGTTTTLDGTDGRVRRSVLLDGAGRVQSPYRGTPTGNEIVPDAALARNHTHLDADPDGSTQVGIGANPDNPLTTLLRLRAVG